MKPYRFRLGKAYFFAKIFVPYLTTAYGQPEKSLISCGFTRLDLFTSTCFCLSWCVTASVISGANGFWLRSIDEFHLLLKEEQTAAYSVEIWKRFRKWGGIPTGITQNIKDLLASREIENIFENSDFIYMLNQASGDRQILAKQLNISPFQLSYVTNSNEGEGLLFYGNTIIPFKDKFDTSLKLYGLMTTKPNEIAKYREKKDA